MITKEKIQPDVGGLAEVHFKNLRITCECIIVNAGPRGIVTAYLTKPVETKEEGGIDSLYIHLANFPKFQGYPIADHVGATWLGRLILEGTAWVMDIDQVDPRPSFWQKLAEEGGYGITHVARLHRKDDQPFGPGVARNLIDRTLWLSTFIRGAWCRPVISVGTQAGEVKWEMWDGGPVDAAGYYESWFPRKHTDDLAPLFDSFTQGSLTAPWNEILQRAIHFYIVANSEKSELGLVIAQAVLESLAWYVVVDSRQACSKSNFNGLSDAKRIRFLLRELQICTDIPDRLHNLTTLASAREWDDGPRAIAELRNGVVHANKSEKTFGSPVRARWEALDLTLWYVELVLLQILDYNGVYMNRLWAPARKYKLSSVPWAT